ncbi:MAG TPA: S9 family peptidase [Thermoanaerobaculia bacterium]|jgi:dipeptidyl aminopeptidase/acylaminoacyl peptidase|nr:S9 family peptidase [Thermoanaerobaculia bacterium]
MKRLTAFVAVLLIAAAALAAKQPITHETLWLMKRVGAPVISLDGRWVAFSVIEPAYDEKDQITDLWIVPADGSAKPHKITFSKASESDVTWSPDSRRIAFTAKREGDEVSQLYVLDIAGGGEAQRMSNGSTAVRSPKFSDDGKNILFVSSVFRGAADDEANKKAAKEAKDRKANVRVYESYPIRNWDRWIEADKQVHLFVQPLADGAKAKDILAGTQLVTSAGFGGTSQGEGGETIRAVWSPDGQWIVFGITTERNTAAYAEVATDLYRVRASGGEPERIAHGEGSHSQARFSPDGKALYAIFNPNNKLPYNNNRLVVFDWPSMTNRREIVGPPFDRSVGGYAITSDGRTIYFAAEDAGLEKIYVVSSKGGDARLAIEPERGVYTDLDIAEKAPSLALVGRWGSSVDPQEIVRIDPATKTRRNLTDFNVEKAASLDWQPPQHFWFTTKDGLRLHNMIVVPENFDPNKKYPLFVLIHGGAASMWRDQISLRWNYHLLAKPGYVMLMTDYRGSTGYGEKLGQAIQNDPLRGPGNDVNEGADEAIKRFPFIDGARQVAGGASYGGHLANWMEATTTRYKAIISHAGLATLQTQWGTSDSNYHRELMVGGPFWETSNKLWVEQSPLTYANQFKTPILMSVGERDFRVPMNNTLEMWAALQRMKVPSKLLVWPEENHWILNGNDSKFFYEQVWDWISKWVNR